MYDDVRYIQSISMVFGMLVTFREPTLTRRNFREPTLTRKYCIS